MNKDIFAGCTLNKAVPLGTVKPFDCSLLFHKHNSFRLSFEIILPHSQSRVREEVAALGVQIFPATKRAIGWVRDRFAAVKCDCATQKHQPGKHRLRTGSRKENPSGSYA